MAAKAPAPAPAVPAESTSLAEIAKRPDAIKLFGHVHEVLEEMTVHARNGYRLYPGMQPSYYERTGMMAILLQLGDPMPLSVQRAAETMAHEQREEAAEFERRVAAEAKRISAEKARADLEAQVAAAQAIADAQVARIRADADAAIARLQKEM